MSFRDIWQAQKHGLQSLASVGVIGMHMVSGPIVGVAIGWGLDKWLGTSPWFKLIFLLIGIGAGFLNVYVDTSSSPLWGVSLAAISPAFMRRSRWRFSVRLVMVSLSFLVTGPAPFLLLDGGAVR